MATRKKNTNVSKKQLDLEINREDGSGPIPDHQPGRPDQRQPKFAEGGRARSDAARRFHHA